MTPAQLPDGLVAVVKRDCPTCVMVAPVLAELSRGATSLTVVSQDDPGFPTDVERVVDDRSLELSWRNRIDAVPTLLRVEDGQEQERTVGWERDSWERLSGQSDLGSDLPDHRPGCGSASAEPQMAAELEVRYGSSTLRSRRVELGSAEDPSEAAFDRGWTDGLPVVPPTEERVMAMLGGTSRPPDQVVADVPPDRVPCTVEKIAVNAVLAGCRPEYLPVVLAAVEAACTDEFNIHGVLATTWFAGPVVIVNGPIRTSIGMNSGTNALGQGNRANATIGRALQLVVRNVGGGRPDGVDRAALGTPGKYTFCFAEAEEGSPWEPLAESRGQPAGRSAVTLFAGGGVQGMMDQLSREPESLARSFAASLRTVGHAKLAMGMDAVVVVSPEHGRVFREAGWTRQRLLDRLGELLTVPGDGLLRGADGIAEGLPRRARGRPVPKFRPGGLLLVHAGGSAGLFSAIIGGWASGPVGSEPVSREVST